MRVPLGTAARQRYVERHTPSRFADRVVALLNGTADVAATGSGGR
jgi:hypothetical protein